MALVWHLGALGAPLGALGVPLGALNVPKGAFVESAGPLGQAFRALRDLHPFPEGRGFYPSLYPSPGPPFARPDAARRGPTRLEPGPISAGPWALSRWTSAPTAPPPSASLTLGLTLSGVRVVSSKSPLTMFFLMRSRLKPSCWSAGDRFSQPEGPGHGRSQGAGDPPG